MGRVKGSKTTKNNLRAKCEICRNERRIHARNMCDDCYKFYNMVRKFPHLAYKFARDRIRELNKDKPRLGRPKTFGRFENRQDLEDKVLYLWSTTNMSHADISKEVRTSAVTVGHILRDIRKREEKERARRYY